MLGQGGGSGTWEADAAGPVPREETPAKLSPGLLRALVLTDVCWAYRNLPQLAAILSLAPPCPPHQAAALHPSAGLGKGLMDTASCSPV